MKSTDENEKRLNASYYNPSIRMHELETVKAETLIQRIARNIAWYALRVARPEYCNAYAAVTFKFINIEGRQKLATHVHCDELTVSHKEHFGDTPPVPACNVIFRH
ncbi:hypothetical protein [Citrobacter braakii]|uniref:hypothetical protein n=1 Tax=Citrobacter braakii TaxID=57706 RepID=UPI00403931D0